jgi:hypothetical protein
MMDFLLWLLPAVGLPEIEKGAEAPNLWLLRPAAD